MANAKKLTNIIIKVLKNRGLSPTHAMISAKALINAGVDVLVIDIAHGHSIMVPPVIANIKKIKNITVIANLNFPNFHPAHPTKTITATQGMD